MRFLIFPPAGGYIRNDRIFDVCEEEKLRPPATVAASLHLDNSHYCHSEQSEESHLYCFYITSVS
jgi:hypothetical protein